MKGQLSRLQSVCLGRLENLTRELAETNDLEAFAEGFYDLLEYGQSHSWKLGRLLAGGRTRGNLTIPDQINGRALADSELDYLLSFMDTIQEGRYTNDDGSLKLASIYSRGSLYIKRLKGTANEAFVVESPEDSDFVWQLGTAEHCSDCIEFASHSPYKSFELTNFPGDGNTECRVNCKCTLIRLGNPQIMGF